MKNLIAMILCLAPVSALAENSERQFVVECSETVLPSGQGMAMNANYTFRDPVNDWIVTLVVPFTRYKTNLLFHLDFNKGGESRIIMKLNEDNVANDLAAVSSSLHLDGRDVVEVVYSTSKSDITSVKASCSIKPRN